jgi:hypothetical protein
MWWELVRNLPCLGASVVALMQEACQDPQEANQAHDQTQTVDEQTVLENHTLD